MTRACRVSIFSIVLVISSFFSLSVKMLTPPSVWGSVNPDPEANGFVPASVGLPGPPASQHSAWFGDINNDGWLDLATAGYEGVRVWAGDGAGNWYLNSTGLPVGTYGGGVCLGDINNDGNLDIAVTSYDGTAGVRVWTGDGNGSWAPASAGLPTGEGHTGIFFADVNHDNNLDLAIASDILGANPGGVQVFRGNGAGSWTSSSSNLPTSGKYYGVWIDDVNNDGDMDLAVAGEGLHIWLGDGSGGWTERSDGLPMTDQWNSVTLGDLNLDGNIDVVSAMDQGGHGIRAWIGDGKGNWTAASNGLPGSGVFYGIVLSDMVGDKYPDILTGEFGGVGIKIFQGDGGNLWVDVSTGLPSGKVIGVAAGDIDRDGYVDIGAVGEGFGVRVLVNDAPASPLVVNVKMPDGGESWEVATQHYINWTAVGGTAPLTISLVYSTTGVLGPYMPIAGGEANDGTYTWMTPVTPSAICFVKVVTTDSMTQTNWDTSNNSFTIFLADQTPPTIGGLTPPDGSTTGDATPLIRAIYSDSSGIAVPSVTIKVDSINVTGLATVTANDVTYVPSVPLSGGVHVAYVEVGDDYVSHNLAFASWSFTVDLSPPSISNLLPPNLSTVSTGTPAIGASYNDPSGVNSTSVVLKVDTVDVTASATVNAGWVLYVPSTPLPDGLHEVYIEVSDSVLPHNTANVTWHFTIDTTIPDLDAPVVSNLEPANHSIVSDSTPTIGAIYSDASGINTTSVHLRVDSLNVSATVTPVNVTYIPPSPLSNGVHDVYLEVKDASVGQNRATVTWQFTVDMTLLDYDPPFVANLLPTNFSIVGSSRPTIGADYSDASGINVSSVLLFLDTVDITMASTVTAFGVTHVPPSPLAEGVHLISLSVRDASANRNLAVAAWQFRVDTSPPTVISVSPANHSAVIDQLPTIEASYFDVSIVNTSTVVLKVDSVDVTASSTIFISDVAYVPSSPLSIGTHDVHLSVSDSATPANKRVVTWWFSIISSPPLVENIRPANHSVTSVKRPAISADYSSPSGISVPMVVLLVDSTNMTSSAIVGQDGITYTPPTSLSDGLHSVHLEVCDDSPLHRRAVILWDFTVDSLPPQIGDLRPANNTTIVNKTLTVGASYSDASGINVTSVVLKVDSIDVTPSATIGQTEINLIMQTAVPDGTHALLLTANDNAYPPNAAVVQWSFRIDTTPPTIALAPPPTGLTAGRDAPISADVTDVSGVAAVILYLRQAGEQQYDSSPMSHTTGTQYIATIAGSLTTSRVEYYIEAVDTLGNIGRRPVSNWLADPYILDLPAPPTESAFPWWIVIAIAIVVAAVVVAVGLYLIIGRKEAGKDQEAREQGENEKT